MKVECTIEAQSFDGIIPGAECRQVRRDHGRHVRDRQARRGDGLHPGLRHDRPDLRGAENRPARDYALNAKVFSLASNEAGAAAAVEELKPVLKGKTIGVQGSSIAANFLDKYFKGTAEIREYKTTEQHDLDLTAGRIDAIMASTAYLSGSAAKTGNEEMTLVGPRFQGGMLGRGSSVGLRKTDPS